MTGGMMRKLSSGMPFDWRLFGPLGANRLFHLSRMGLKILQVHDII